MPRKFLNRYLPDQETIHRKLHAKWYMRPFDFLWHEPALWHISRRGTCGALALGAFISCLPVPGHMVLAVLGAIYWRVNLPVALAAIWINNPLTIGPIYYTAYRLGRWGLDVLHMLPQPREPNATALHSAELAHTWHAVESVLLGGVIEGLLFALMGYFALDMAWRLSIRGRWKLRQIEREGRQQG